MVKSIDIPYGLNEFEPIPENANRVVISQFTNQDFQTAGLYVLQHHNSDNPHTRGLYKIGTAQNLKRRLGSYSGYIPEGIFVKAVIPLSERNWTKKLEGKSEEYRRKKRLDDVSKLIKDELQYKGAKVPGP